MYSKECVETFLKQQGQLFDEPVAETYEEAEEFLEMRQGDRIGHGTAAGISPALWMERVGDNVHISQGEWMDDLLVTYYLISSEYNPYISLKSLLTKLKDEIEDLAFKIYQKPTSNYSIIR